MDELAALDVQAVDHVGIAVPDLDAAISFYTGTIGGHLEHREHNADQRIDEAMIAFGDAGTSSRIQLIAPADPESAIARFLDRHGPGLQQLAVRVPDVLAAAEVLRARGMRLLYDEPRRGTAGSTINFVHPKDAGGVLIELVQAPVGAAPAAGRLDGHSDRAGAVRTSAAGAGRASDAAAPGDGTMST